MFCPSDVNTGFINIVGPISQQDLNTITVKSYPLSVSFKPRTTIPSLLGNRIDESTGIENTCTYRGKRFNLADVQICSVLSKGYILPGIRTEPVAELVLSFSANNAAADCESLSGILLCVPIYDSGTPNHNAYLDRIIDPDNKDYIQTNNKSAVPNLESIFYGWKGDTTQTSIAYKTCFETINATNNLPQSRSLYVVVFPNGITLRADIYQKLKTKFNTANSYPSYSVPASIRGGDPTLKSYKLNNQGNKVPTIISTDGNIYLTPLSSCTDDFKHRFEYFTLPPRSSSSTSTSTDKWNSEQCPYYKTNQYKCVPFNQSKDLSGNLVVPGNKTLETILSERKETEKNATTMDSGSKSLTTEEIEGIVAGVAGVAIVAVICLKVGDWISKEA
jgi:hypothetical protein